MNRLLGDFLDSFRSRRFVTAELDSRFLHLVEAQQVGKQARIIKLCSSAVPDGLDLADAKAVGQFLHQALKQFGLAGMPMLMSVPRGQAILKTISLPSGASASELPAMVQYQVEKELPLRGDEAVVDFTTQPHAGAPGNAAAVDQVGVLVAAVRLPVVDYYRQVALAGGARLRHLGLRPYANLNCLAASGLAKTYRCNALVHVGFDETEIDVINDGFLVFSRSAVIKIPPADQAQSSSAEAMPAVLSEITRTLQSYNTIEGGGKIEAVIVAGGSGLEQALCDELSRRLGLPCRAMNAPKDLGLEDNKANASCLSALGLAKASCAGDLPFDFLNPKRPVVRKDQRKVKVAAAACLAAAIVISSIAGGATYLSGKGKELARLKVIQDTAQKENEIVRGLKKNLTALEKWSSQSPAWLEHWSSISHLMPPCEDAYIQGLRTNADGSMSFTIRAKTDDVLSELCRRLEKAGYAYTRGAASSARDDFGYTFRSDLTISGLGKVKVSLPTTLPARPADDASLDPPAPRRPTSRPAVPPAPGKPASPAVPPSAAAPAPANVPPPSARPAPSDSDRSGFDRRRGFRRGGENSAQPPQSGAPISGQGGR